MTLLSGALMGILEEAGEALLTLTEDVEPGDFFRSRLTRDEALRQLRIMVETANNVPPEIKQRMPEVDWAGWAMLGSQVKLSGGLERDAVWFAIRALAPALLMWLRVYRKNAPEIFSLVA